MPAEEARRLEGEEELRRKEMLLPLLHVLRAQSARRLVQALLANVG